jgi:hypothetical protein
VTVRIITGDCRSTLADLEDASIHCCVAASSSLLALPI